MGSLTREQISIITGCILGDGAMRCKTNALLEINHSIEQKDYVDWKYSKLKSLVNTAPKSRKSNGKRVAYRFTTRSLPELTEIYRRFFVNGRKTIPHELFLDPLSLAVWFMDDGCKSYRAVYFNTQKFDMESQLRFISLFDREFGLRLTLNKDKTYYRLRMSVASVESFRKLVEPHMIPQLLYKLP